MAWPAWIPQWLRRAPEPVVHAPPLGTLTIEQYMMGRDNDQRYQAECTLAVQANAIELVRRVNLLLGRYGATPAVNSGWRPAAINKSVGGAKGSAHLTGEAVDLRDDAGKLKAWIEANLYELERAGLWMEDPAHTKTWAHLQTRRASTLIFKP